jgi:hypothetical protein
MEFGSTPKKLISPPAERLVGFSSSTGLHGWIDDL